MLAVSTGARGYLRFSKECKSFNFKIKQSKTSLFLIA